MIDYKKLWDEKVRANGIVMAAISPRHDSDEDKVFVEMARERIASVLDCGCGYGRLMKYFDNIWGLDCSTEMLNKNPFYPHRAFCHDLTKKFPFKDKFFDYSFSSLVLMHLPMEDAVKVLLEMKRVTKKKMAFNMSSLKGRGNKILFDKLTENYPITNRFYSLSGVEKLLSDSCLEEISEVNMNVRGIWHITVDLSEK